jgi:hypothetical protein
MRYSVFYGKIALAVLGAYFTFISSDSAKYQRVSQGLKG